MGWFLFFLILVAPSDSFFTLLSALLFYLLAHDCKTR